MRIVLEVNKENAIKMLAMAHNMTGKNLLDIYGNSDRSIESLLLKQYKVYGAKDIDRESEELLNLYDGMSDTMKTSIKEIMKTTQISKEE